MGHIFFIFLHICALLLAMPALLVTITLHLIYSAIRANRPRETKPTPWTHVRCPDCRELILKDASVCKHCGCRLTPQ